MDADFRLVAVAFLRSTGGRVRVLFAVDREGVQLFDGEPALLVVHRPGAGPGDLAVEGADRIPAATVELVHRRVGSALAELVEAAHDEFGQLDGERLLGRGVELHAPFACFDDC